MPEPDELLEELPDELPELLDPLELPELDEPPPSSPGGLPSLASSPPSLEPVGASSEPAAPDELDELDEEASSVAPSDEASPTSSPLLVPPGPVVRSVDPPLAHAAPKASDARTRIAAVPEKQLEQRLTQRMDFGSSPRSRNA
jgi:hypothetical protein